MAPDDLDRYAVVRVADEIVVDLMKADFTAGRTCVSAISMMPGA